MAGGTSAAARAGRATRTEIGRAAASHTYVASARVRQRSLDNRRVRSESIMRSKPSAEPAAARCKRRISRASHRHAGGTHAPGADASSRWSRSQYNAFGPMAANESSGLSFYPLGDESAGPNPRFRGGFALRHALFQLVSACFAAAWQVASLGVSGNSKRRKFTRVPHAARACATPRLLRNGFERDAFGTRPHESDRGHHDHHRAGNEREHAERAEALQHGRDHERREDRREAAP